MSASPALSENTRRIEAGKTRREVIRKRDGSVIEIVKEPGKSTIVHHRRPSIKIFHEPVKCPLYDCNVYFATDYDLQFHLETHWKPLKNGGEWIEAEVFPNLRNALMNAKFILKGKHEYRLAAEGRIIIRKQRTVFNTHVRE